MVERRQPQRNPLKDMHAHAAALWRDYVEHVYALERFKPLPEESPLPPTTQHIVIHQKKQEPTPGRDPEPKGDPPVPSADS